MIRKNIGLLLKNKTFILIWLLLFFLNGVLTYKATIDDIGDVGAYDEAMRWLAGEEDPMESLDEYSSTMFDLGSEELRFTNYHYREHTFISQIREYVEGIENYEDTLKSIIQSSKDRSMFSLFDDKDQSYSIDKTIDTYSHLININNQPEIGNYFALERFFQMDLIDGIMIILILAACTFLLLEEKERGMYMLVKTTKRGHASYFVWKTGALIAIVITSGILFYSQTFYIYSKMFGVDSLSATIQSVPGYLLCPYNVSILGYLGIYSLLKIGALIVITLFVIFTCNLPIKTAPVYLLNSLVVGLNAVLYLGIDRSSRYVIWKYANYGSLMDVKNYTSQLNFVRVAGKEFLLLNISLAFLFILMLVTFFAGLASYLSYKRTRSLQFKKRFDIPLFGFRVLPNEATRILILQGGLVLIIAFIVSVFYMNDFKESRNINNIHRKNYVKYLNSMDKENASLWIEEKLEEFTYLEEEKIRFGMMFESGEITEMAYFNGIQNIDQQLEIRPIIIELQEQSQHIEKIWSERGISCDYVYEPLYNVMFGEEGHTDRYMKGILLALFSVCLLIPIFTYDNQNKMDRLLKVTKKGDNSLVRSRFGILLSLEVFMLIVLKFVSYIALNSKYGLIGLSSKVQSISYLENFPFPISIGAFLAIQFVIEAIFIILIGILLISLSIKGKDVVLSLLIGILFFVCPIVLGLLNFIPAKRYWISPFIVTNPLFLEGNISIYLNIAIVSIAIYLFYKYSIKDWRSGYGIKSK